CNPIRIVVLGHPVALVTQPVGGFGELQCFAERVFRRPAAPHGRLVENAQRYQGVPHSHPTSPMSPISPMMQPENLHARHLHYFPMATAGAKFYSVLFLYP